MRNIVKKDVTGLSLTTRLVTEIRHDEEETPRSLKRSINATSPVCFILWVVWHGYREPCLCFSETHFPLL